MNSDLISRVDLKIEIEKQIAYCDDRSKHQSDLGEVLRYSNTSYGLRLAHNYIDNAPAVHLPDGCERPNGAWVKTGQSLVNPNKFRNFCCSNCLWELDEHVRIEPNFCPNCGAEMQKGGKE